MALFLIFSESWQSFCQTVQQTFPMRGKTLPDRKYVFQNPDKKLKIGIKFQFRTIERSILGHIDEVLALDSAKSYLRKQVTIGRTATRDLNKSAALATFQKKSEKKSHFPASFWKSSSK